MRTELPENESLLKRSGYHLENILTETILSCYDTEFKQASIVRRGEKRVKKNHLKFIFEVLLKWHIFNTGLSMELKKDREAFKKFNVFFLYWILKLWSHARPYHWAKSPCFPICLKLEVGKYICKPNTWKPETGGSAWATRGRVVSFKNLD